MARVVRITQFGCCEQYYMGRPLLNYPGWWSNQLILAGSADRCAFLTRRPFEGILGIRRERATTAGAHTGSPEGSATVAALTALRLFDVCPICLHKRALQGSDCDALNP